MGKKGSIILFFLAIIIPSLSFSEAWVPFYQYCKSNNYELKYNISLSTISVIKGPNEIKLFMNMPYLVFDGNIFYMKDKPKFWTNGEILLPAEYISSIQNIFESNVQISSIVTLTNLVTNTFIFVVTNNKTNNPIIPREQFLTDPKADLIKTNDIKPLKDDKIIKRDYNDTNDNFKPIDTIIIDAGHGGKDPGGLGINGIKEKEIVLHISLILENLLKTKGMKKIILTRDRDVFVTLNERTEISSKTARKNNAIFVSVHGNISLDKNIKGLEVYSLADKASDEEAYSVEVAENAQFSRSDIEKTATAFNIIQDLAKDEMKRESDVFAKAVAVAYIKETGLALRGVKKANFYVLKFNPVPSILVEVGFMSNPSESKKLMEKDFHHKMASGIANGIISFINSYNKSRGFTQ